MEIITVKSGEKMAWYRMHTDILDDDKLRKIPKADCWNFALLLAYAKELEAEGGEKGEIKKPLSDICWRLRMTKKELEKTIKLFTDAGIIINDSNGLQIINYPKRQYDSGYQRLKKHRKKKRNDNANDNAGDNGHDNTGDNVITKRHDNTTSARGTETDTDITPIVPLKGDVVKSFPSDGIPYAEILQDLVEKTGLKIDFENEVTLRQIRTLWRKGYALDDFRHVHTVKAVQWGNDGAKRAWLHPNTLYKDNKFDVYRNEEEPIIEGQEPWRF